MKPAGTLLLLLLAAAAVPAGGAVVRLKDGGRLEGDVVKADSRELVIRTAEGTRRVDAGLVQSVEYETPPPRAALPSPPAAPAWRSEDRNVVSFGLGLAAPLSSVDFKSIGGGEANDGDLGPILGVRWLRTMSGGLAAGLDMDYLHRSQTASPGLLPRADSSVAGDNLLLLAIARWHMTDRGVARPYLLGGAGASRSWTRIESAPIRGFAWTDTNTDEARRLVDDSVWAWAWTARAGVDFNWEFADPAVFGLEAGLTGLESRTYSATGAGRDLGLSTVSSRLNLFTLTARWSWRW